MAKVLSWNIKSFHSNKILEPVPPTQDEYGLWQVTRDYVGESLLATLRQADPDIFVVQEVSSNASNWAKRGLGTLIGGGGEVALLRLLAQLRLFAADWALVPAVRLNNAASGIEGIGVFYRSDRMQFSGPLYWPGPNTVSSTPIVAVAIETPTSGYPAPWQACLPARDAKCAGQVIYRKPDNSLVGFPAAGDRKPFYTIFREIATGRTIHLASVHLPPSNVASAKKALKVVLSTIPAIAQPAANSVGIVIGDFNLDRNDPTVAANLFGDTTTAAADWVFDAPANSMYRSVASSTPFEYITTRLYDNAVVRYGAGTAQALDGSVGDIVAGASMDRNGAAIAGQTFPATLSMSLAAFQIEIVNPMGLMYDPQGSFAQPANFGHVAPKGGISDHRPILVTL